MFWRFSSVIPNKKDYLPIRNKPDDLNVNVYASSIVEETNTVLYTKYIGGGNR
jgi:hypothetical protein